MPRLEDKLDDQKFPIKQKAVSLETAFFIWEQFQRRESWKEG